jgi:uncharacterized protein (DUF1778 family)
LIARIRAQEQLTTTGAAAQLPSIPLIPPISLPPRQPQATSFEVVIGSVRTRVPPHIAGYGNLPYSCLMDDARPMARLEARLPAEIHAVLKRAAEIQGRSLTDFVVSAAREAAERTIRETEIIRLAVEDQRRIAEALLDPPEPGTVLKRAAERHRKLLGSR